jgi:hypothetical protein
MKLTQGQGLAFTLTINQKLIPTGRCEVGIAPKLKLIAKKTLTRILTALQNTKKFQGNAEMA